MPKQFIILSEFDNKCIIIIASFLLLLLKLGFYQVEGKWKNTERERLEIQRMQIACKNFRWTVY